MSNTTQHSKPQHYHIIVPVISAFVHKGAIGTCKWTFTLTNLNSAMKSKFNTIKDFRHLSEMESNVYFHIPTSSVEICWTMYVNMSEECIKNIILFAWKMLFYNCCGTHLWIVCKWNEIFYEKSVYWSVVSALQYKVLRSHVELTIYRVAPQNRNSRFFRTLLYLTVIFFILLHKASFPHCSNTKIIKFGWELFILWVISYGLSFSGFAINLSLIMPRNSGNRANPENDSPSEITHKIKSSQPNLMILVLL